MNTLGKIEALEGKLNAAVTAQPAAVDALNRRISEAEAILETFQKSPAECDIDKALAAVSTVTAGKTLLANFGEEKPWRAFAQHSWIVRHRAELAALLEKMIQERSAGREAYMEASAVELGRLTVELARADGNGADDGEIERLNFQLAAVENERAVRLASLAAASDALKVFVRAPADANAYLPIFKAWRNARTACALAFSEAVNLEKAQA